MLNDPRTEFIDGLLGRRQRLGQFILFDGERHVGQTVAADVLDDHVDGNLPFGHLGENQAHDAGPVGNVPQADAGFGFGQRGSRHDVFFIAVRSDQGPGAIGIGRSDQDRHVIFFGEFNGPGMHHAGAQAGQLAGGDGLPADRQLAAIQQVTAADVQRVAKTYLTTNNKTVAVTIQPKKEEAK